MRTQPASSWFPRLAGAAILGLCSALACAAGAQGQPAPDAAKAQPSDDADQPPAARAGESPAADGAADDAADDGADGAGDEGHPDEPGAVEDEDWRELADDAASRNARIPMVIPDMSRQPQPPGADFEPPPTHSWTWYSLTAGRVNPLGASTQLESGYRLQLWRLPGQLYEQSFFALKGTAQVTPAFAKLGGKVELQPLAMLNLSAGLSYVHSFGIFNFVQSFDRLDAEYDDATLDEIDKVDNHPNASQSVSGYQVDLAALVQAKVWNIAVRNRTAATKMDLSLPAGRVGFWDVTTDIMFPNGGWVLTNDTDLLYITDVGLNFGARWTYTHAYYGDDPLGAVNVPTHRVGPAVVYTFFDDPEPSAYDRPTLALLVQWWAQHRYRTGAASSGAIPYLLLAFIQQGDLVTGK